MNLKHFRIRAGLTQKELALASGYTENYIWKIENGQRKGSGVHVMKRLADALSITIDDLIK